MLDHIARGDLTVSIRREYVGVYTPIKSAVNSITEILNATMADIQGAVEQVASGAEQISTSSVRLADGAVRQSASIEELSNSLMLIHEKAAQASNDASSANDGTSRSKENTLQGKNAVQSMTDTMNKIKTSGEGITRIIDVISNISFQTNLLALNAAVEAAHAGEHGKGFVIVAEEVRSLAGRSQEATSDTAKIIAEDKQNVAEGIKAAREVVASFETIAGSIGEISSLVSHITDISDEQLKSLAAINTSVSEITNVVTDVSTLAEESASASQELSSQAEMLREKILFFKLC